MPPTLGNPGLIALAAALNVASLLAFAALMLYRAWALTAGKRESRFDRPGTRVRLVITRVFGQSLVLRRPVMGLAHVAIFWGFLILAASSIQFLGEGVRPGFAIPYLMEAPWYRFLFDLFAALALLATLYAAFRRAVLRPRALTSPWGTYFVLFLIFGLMLTDLVSEGYRVASSGGWVWTSPVSSAVAVVLAAAGAVGAGAYAVFAASWWAHFLLMVAFRVAVPLSRLLHLFAAPFNVFFADLGPRGLLKDCDVENDEADHFGVVRADEFTWRQLLDFYSCMECGRCQDNCPAFNTDKPLSPKKVVVDLKRDFMAYGLKIVKLAKTPPVKEEGVGLAGNVISDDELWACTTCFACVEHCPVSVEHVNKIIDLRRDLVLNEGRVPHELNAAMNGVERNNNPYGLPSSERAKWANGLDVPVFGKGAQAEYCLWVSCLGSYDDRGQRVAKATVKLLNAAGVSYAILGEEEGCCAEAFRRLGHEYLYKMKLEENVATFARYGITKIITSCPHCYNTFKHEYKSLGCELTVYHHAEFVAGLITDGRLKARGTAPGRVAYHDSCYLGRYNNIYEAPRALLRAAGAEPLEFDKNRAHAFCCGAGGGRMWLEETLGKRINVERAEQALAAGAPAVAVACAYCLTMLDDGLKDLNADVPVKDVAELLADGLT